VSRPARVSINTQALRNNLLFAKRLSPESRVMAVIKANAYGHGLTDVINALEPADAFAVASIDEALLLREAGCRKTIVLLEGVFSADELTWVVEHDLQLVVHHEQQLQMLEQYAGTANIDVWLKIDSGMHRLGIEPERVPAAWQRLHSSGRVGQVRLMTHMACADQPDHPMNGIQLESFERVVNNIPAEQSIANSAVIMSSPDMTRDWVRPGIMLYGSSPLAGRNGLEHGLQPVMRLESELIAVKRVGKGETVGYGAAWEARADTVIGVVAIGYGDGYPRHAADGTPVWAGGRRVPLVGRVSMDMVTVDLGADAKARPGESVELWGSHISIDEVAQHAGTIGYELMCGVTGRVKRIIE
jgi:alanine racemase